MSQKNSKIPLVIICGATGTGKSKLAIEIAKHYNGEVINADALQIYKGMDIATNKVTENECQGVKHHLLGFESIDKLNYTIHDFQKAALCKINELKMEIKMPVLVGGTNYYLESILWNRLVGVDGDCTKMFESMENIELHNYLRSIDPDSAMLIHPNTRRKVLRAIEISLNSNQSQHNHLQTQLISRRYPLNETVFIWVYSDKESLYPRLENRVDAMVAGGLLSELNEMQVLFEKLCPQRSFTKGVFQAIGFKEFSDYLLHVDKESESGQQILANCVEKLKLANKRYVNVQHKWIINRFLRQADEETNIPLFRVDSSDVSRWNDAVLKRSIDIIEDVIRNREERVYSTFVDNLVICPEVLSGVETFTPCNKVCEGCDNQLFVSLQAWEAHIRSKRHQKRRKSLMKVAHFSPATTESS